MSAASCDKLIRAACTGDISEVDSGTLSKLSSEDICKLRLLTLEGGEIKYAGDGMWGTLLSLNLLFGSQDDEAKIRSYCGDKLSIFMLALVCARSDLCRTLLNTFNIPLAVRTHRGLSTLDLSPKALKSDLLRLLELELQGVLARKPEPSMAPDSGMTRYNSARDLGPKPAPLPPMSRNATQPDLSHYSEKVNRKASIDALSDFSQIAQPNRKASATVDSRLADMSLSSSSPMNRAQLDAMSQSSSLEQLQLALRSLEMYVEAERTRLSKEKQIKSMEMMAASLKDTEAGQEAARAAAEARGATPAFLFRPFTPIERVVHRRSLRARGGH